MAEPTLGQITLVYRGETRQFSSVSQAAHFLRQDRIKMGWFRQVRITIDLAGAGAARLTWHLKGDKFRTITALEQLEGALKKSTA